MTKNEEDVQQRKDSRMAQERRPARSRQPAKPTAKPAVKPQPKTQWRIIQGDCARILKTIQDSLENTGDDLFEIEFRIYKSARKPGKAPSPRGAARRSSARRPAAHKKTRRAR